MLCYIKQKGKVVMAREGVTYEEYKAVADKLTAEGVKPTVRKVRAELGTGSYATLLVHANQYKGIQHNQDQITQEIPDALIQNIKKALAEAARTATEATELALNEARAQLKEDETQLTEYEQKIEEQNSTIRQHLDTIQQIQIDLESAHATSENQHAEQAAHIKDLSERLDNTLKQATHSNTEAAKAQLQLERADIAIEQAEKRADSADRDNQELKKESNSAEKRAATAEAVVSEQLKAIAKLEQDLSRTNEEQRQTVGKLEQDLNRVHEEQKIQRDQAIQQQVKLDNMGETKSEATKLAAVFETKNTALMEQISALKSQLEQK
jgi:chromosome segregation ATPase